MVSSASFPLAGDNPLHDAADVRRNAPGNHTGASPNPWATEHGAPTPDRNPSPLFPAHDEVPIECVLPCTRTQDQEAAEGPTMDINGLVPTYLIWACRIHTK